MPWVKPWKGGNSGGIMPINAATGRHYTGINVLILWSARDEHGYPSLQWMTSNLPFDEWTSVFGSERLTGALLDRLTHRVHILEMNGDSYRLNQSKRRSRRASAATPADNPTQA